MKSTSCLFGAIARDVIGSRFEWKRCPDPEFPLFSKSSRFTDDTVLTVAVADAILNQRGYPKAGYGSYFRRWLRGDSYRCLGLHFYYC